MQKRTISSQNARFHIKNTLFCLKCVTYVSHFRHRSERQFLGVAVISRFLPVVDFWHQLAEACREADVQQPEGEEGEGKATDVVQE